jgi:glycosyltransferase involved in cell wall biosynthesis
MCDQALPLPLLSTVTCKAEVLRELTIECRVLPGLRIGVASDAVAGRAVRRRMKPGEALAGPKGTVSVMDTDRIEAHGLGRRSLPERAKDATASEKDNATGAANWSGASGIPVPDMGGLRVAIVHDWLYTLGGAERVLCAILRCFPEATVYALFDLLTESERATIGHTATKTSFLQRMPGIARWHRLYLPLMPLAVEQFDLSQYDLIISSSYAVAKGVLTGPDQLHLAYVHSPMRYAWDLQHQYLREAGLEKGIRSWMTRILLHRIRIWDSRTANGVDGWIANSHFVARRIQKIYGRKAVVIPPPVEVPPAPPSPQTGDYFLTVSRLVPYKNIRAIVDAFAALPEERLIVVGEGPEEPKLRRAAGGNVEIRGFVADQELRRLMREARAFVFAAEEDFGIAPIEAQSEGTPVIALGRGGACETIVTDGAAPTGLFFRHPEPAEIVDAVQDFLRNAARYPAAQCWRNAMRFSEERFMSEFVRYVRAEMEAFRDRMPEGRAWGGDRGSRGVISLPPTREPNAAAREPPSIASSAAL